MGVFKLTKRKFGLGLSLVLAAGTILGACGSKDEEKTDEGSNTGSGTEEKVDFSLAMVTDVGGVDDKSFNQLAWEGIEAFGKEHGLKKVMAVMIIFNLNLMQITSITLLT